MVITVETLNGNLFLSRKIQKVAQAEKMTFSEAANFLLLRWFHLNSRALEVKPPSPRVRRARRAAAPATTKGGAE